MPSSHEGSAQLVPASTVSIGNTGDSRIDRPIKKRAGSEDNATFSGRIERRSKRSRRRKQPPLAFLRLTAAGEVQGRPADENCRGSCRQMPGCARAIIRSEFPRSFARSSTSASSAAVRPGSGSAFTMLPTDNATGNFVRVVQRVPVKIRFPSNPLPGRIVPGLSARVEITSEADHDHGRRLAAEPRKPRQVPFFSPASCLPR